MRSHACIVMIAALAGTFFSAEVRAQGIADDAHISAGANGLYWTRSDPQEGSVLNGFLNTGTLTSEWEPGVEGWIHVQDACTPWGVDARYFWLDSFTEQASFSFTGPPIINDAPTTFTFDITLESSLQGAEISSTYKINNCISLLAGFRWIELEEDLIQRIGVIVRNVPPQTAVVDAGVDNDLYGAQFGGSALLQQRPNWEIDLVGKTGIYSNQCGAESTTFINGVAGAPAVSDDGKVAFAADARLGGSLWITPNLVANGGYQVLYLDGIVRGETLAISGVNVDNLSDSLLFHGAFFGVTFYRP